MLAALPLESNAERALQRLAQPLQRRERTAGLHARAGVAGVGGQKPGEVLRVRHRRGAQEHAPQVLEERLATRRGGLARIAQRVQKGGLALRQPEALQHAVCTGVVGPHQHEVAEVGDEHLPVAGEILPHLLAVRDPHDILPEPLHLQRAAGRHLPFVRHLRGRFRISVRGEEAAVGDAGASVT